MAVEVPDTFPWLTEADVCSLIDLGGNIEALEKGFRLEAEGKARNMTKAVWPGGSLNVTGHQAPPQVAAAAAVRGLERMRVFGPAPENRGKFVDLLKSEYGFEVAWNE